MAKNVPVLGLFGGILIAAIVMMLPLEGLSPEGRRCLAVSLLGVIWWAAKVAHPGYVSAAMLMGYITLHCAPAKVVFLLWITPLAYIAIGGYLIAAAVRDSGLGKRIAYWYSIRFISSFKSIIVGAYVIGFLLSFLIPHPWPRSFLIMSFMVTIINSAGISKRDAANIGLAVFGSSAATSAILLTGDATINILAVAASGQDLGWLGWLWQMGLPAAAGAVGMLFLQLWLFKPEKQYTIDREEMRQALKDLGPMSPLEKRTMFWVMVAIVLWITQSLHGIHIGWSAMIVAVCMGLPVIGRVLTPKNWNDVPIATMIFLSAAFAIGKVGAASGMNSWLASVLLPSSAPTNMYMFALLLTAVSVGLHMCMGSVIAVMGVAIPTFVTFATAAGINPLVPALMCYTSIALHFVLPFHHMNVLVGVGEAQGGYGEREIVRLGVPLTIVVFIVTVLIQVTWWKFTGLL